MEENNYEEKIQTAGLDCANCAAKMEEAIKKIEGVSDATVSFMTQKMTIEADDGRLMNHEGSGVCVQEGGA